MASWGRHGWARSNEGYRLYKETDGTYLMHDATRNEYYCYFAIMGNLTSNGPVLTHGEISSDYTYQRRCTRVQWDEVPLEWQAKFLEHLGDVKPETVRGFWLAKRQPVVTT